MADQDRTGYDVHDDEGNVVRHEPDLADVGEAPEDRETVIRFDDDPRDHLVPARMTSGEVNPVVPPDTLLGHLGNVIAVLQAAIAMDSVERLMENGAERTFVALELNEAVRLLTRITGARTWLEHQLVMQSYRDQSAHFDNPPF